MSTLHPSVSAATVDELDARMTGLIVGATRWRLALGDALEHLGQRGGPQALGFSSLGAYAIERCGYSGRWVEEARGLVRRLVSLPRLRRALTDGIVTWSMAQLLARHATPETETDLVTEAALSTLRAMRARLEPGRASTDDDEAPARRTIEARVPIEDAWAFERARMLIEAVTGERAADAIVEHMLAEMMTSLLHVPGAQEVMRKIERAADAARLRAEAMRASAEVRDALDAAFERELAPRAAVAARTAAEAGEAAPAATASHTLPDDLGAAVGDGLEGLDATGLDRRIMAIACELRGRDLSIGRVALAMRDTLGWQILGYRTFEHWTRERLGMSRSVMQAKLALARRCRELPALAAALEAGRVGLSGGAIVGRVARPDTVDAWVERAAERTVKHLREEVEVVSVLARTTGTSVGAPPDDETVEAVHDVERAVLAGEVRMSVGEDDDEAPRGAARVGTVPLRVTVATELADVWMAVRDLYAKARVWQDTDGENDKRSFVAAMSANIMRYWSPTESQPDRPFAPAYLRDRYRCACPTCERRDVGAHHVVFRAHGGSDAPENLVTLCGRCHLDGVHAGHIRVTGRASGALDWRLGADLAVTGRRLRAAA